MTRPPAWQQWIIAAAACAAATALCFWLDGLMSVGGLALVYLVTVVGTGAALDRGPGIGASLACVSALNFFFVPPRYTFEVDGAESWWTLAVLLGASLTINLLVNQLRADRARAESGERRARQLHALGEALASCENAELMAQRAAGWLHEALERPAAILLHDEGGAALRVFVSGMPEGEAHVPSARWAMAHRRPLGRGCDDWADLPLWCAPYARPHAAGAVQLQLKSGDAPSQRELHHWLELALQVGLCVERERAAARARVAEASARAEAVRNTLLASLSHDLHTPLAGMLGNASTLRAHGEAMAARQRDVLLANLENDARDMTLMADNILQMARLSQPHLQVKLRWESLEEAVAAAVTRMRRRWPDARIELRVRRDLPPVRGEATLLAQLLVNLVDNAVRHGGEHPHIVVRAGRSRAGVFVVVRDHGAGLPAGELADLFERYRRGDVPGAGSAGLGLAICRLIADAHGGCIEARRCEPGTEFRLDLPAEAVALAEPHD